MAEGEVRTAPLILPVEPVAGTLASGPVSIHVNNEGGIVDLQSESLAGRLGLARGDRLNAVSNPRIYKVVEGVKLIASATRLTLEHCGRRLHLVSRLPAWFGRQREHPDKGRTIDNAVVLWCFTPDGAEPDVASSKRISRTHFALERDGARCRLRDGAPARDDCGNILTGGPVTASGYGIAVDEKPLSPCGTMWFAAGREAEIALAPQVKDDGVLKLHLKVLPVPENRAEAAGVSLSREDAVPESYLVLWGEVDLGLIDAKLSGRMVSWDGTRFLLRETDGGERPLAVGDVFGAPPSMVRVMPFRQLGV
jgi:hypothetical protein